MSSGGDGGLAEGDASVVGRNLFVEVDLEAGAAQGGDRAGEQFHVLEGSAAETHAGQSDLAAGVHDGIGYGVVEARGNYGARLLGPDDALDGRAEVQFLSGQKELVAACPPTGRRWPPVRWPPGLRS